MDAWTITEVRGTEVESHLEGLASLRIRVFKDFPYLYDGSIEYERNYLRTYFKSPRSFVALCFDGSHGALVGASTAVALADEEESFREPFRKRNIDPATVCYYGESVLLPEMRGRGIGREFMRRREKFARSLPGVERLSFCAVVRDNPPKGYRPLDAFWESEGFREVPGLTTTYSWKDLGSKKETSKQMQFWMKNMEVR
jgi:GNAT superfamily N-acetyltransferase